jgi:hypothetical protein
MNYDSWKLQNDRDETWWLESCDEMEEEADTLEDERVTIERKRNRQHSSSA